MMQRTCGGRCHLLQKLFIVHFKPPAQLKHKNCGREYQQSKHARRPDAPFHRDFVFGVLRNDCLNLRRVLLLRVIKSAGFGFKLHKSFCFVVLSCRSKVDCFGDRGSDDDDKTHLP